MKGINSILGIYTVVMAVGMTVASCQSEAPFSEGGEGNVRLSVDVNTRLTRAVQTVEELKETARIYISDEKGVLNKWVGTQSIPHDGFALRYGSYVAEAFAGDSVSASFDKRYFKGATPFVVSSNDASTQVSVTCKIANVVASIDHTTVKPDLISDLQIVIGNSDGSLTFTDDNLMDYGYFMMSQGDTSLEYTITGVNTKGNAFTKNGEIKNVKPANNYRIKLGYNPTEGNDGGAFLTVSIEEEQLYEDEVVIFGRPVFSWVNTEEEGTPQLIGTPGTFISRTLRVAVHTGFESLIMSTSEPTIISKLGANSIELIDLPELREAEINAQGIVFTDPEEKDGINRFFIEFNESFLNSLPARDTEYVINLRAVDKYGKSNTYDVRIANTEAAIVYSDPVIVNKESFEADLTAVNARMANIPIKLTNEKVQNPQLQYRKAGESTWTSVPVNNTRANNEVTVQIKGLSPSSTYEYRLVAGALSGTTYEFESAVATFTTEAEFIIPNASFEDWSTYSAQTLLGKKTVDLPGSTGDKLTSFWGSGNEGGATANKVLTKKSEDMKHSGTFSARLGSDEALGIIAAGNIFTGYYDYTDGTNGVLQVGKEYDGSHPTKLRVWANYRPGGSVKVNSDNKKYVEVVEGGTDQAQIYVALTVGNVEIRTNPSNRKLFSKDDDNVVAYGEVTWKEAFGPDGALQEVEIPITYNKKAKSVKPTHLVIVCSASKFGDYFCGSSKSVMYLDDFELVYE